MLESVLPVVSPIRKLLMNFSGSFYTVEGGLCRISIWTEFSLIYISAYKFGMLTINYAALFATICIYRSLLSQQMGKKIPAAKLNSIITHSKLT